jgi:DNA primase
MRTPSETKTKTGLNLHVLSGEAVRAPRFVPVPEVKTHERRPAAHLNEVYGQMLARLSLSEAHTQHLLSRGLTLEAVNEFGYASAPCRGDASRLANELSRRYDLRGVPGFFRKRGTWLLRDFGEGILIPTRDSRGCIRAFQVRRTGEWVDPRYVWLSSSDKEDGSSSGTPTAVLRPEWIRERRRVVITEGALKAHVASERLRLGFVAFAGVACVPANFVASLQRLFPEVVRVSIAFDADFRTNVYVRGAILKLLHELMCSRLKADVWVWEGAKGIDDFVCESRAAAA